MPPRTLTHIGWILTGLFMLAGMYLVFFFPSYNDPNRTLKILGAGWTMPLTILGLILLPLLRREPLVLRLRKRWAWNLIRTGVLFLFAYLSLAEAPLQTLNGYDIALVSTAVALVFHTLLVLQPPRAGGVESLIEEIGQE